MLRLRCGGDRDVCFFVCTPFLRSFFYFYIIGSPSPVIPSPVALQSTFEGDLLAAEKGELDAWEADPHAAVALIILQDQFTRNSFRGQGRQFAWDARALATAKRLAARPEAIASLKAVERQFAYMPFMHSESLADQDQCISLFKGLAEEAAGRGDAGKGTLAAATNVLGYADKHRALIAKFGRFPHRNELLGRQSTPEELAQLAAGPGFH